MLSYISFKSISAIYLQQSIFSHTPLYSRHLCSGWFWIFTKHKGIKYYSWSNTSKIPSWCRIHMQTDFLVVAISSDESKCWLIASDEPGNVISLVSIAFKTEVCCDVMSIYDGKEPFTDIIHRVILLCSTGNCDCLACMACEQSNEIPHAIFFILIWHAAKYRCTTWPYTELGILWILFAFYTTSVNKVTFNPASKYSEPLTAWQGSPKCQSIYAQI